MSEKRFRKLSSSIDYYLIWDTKEEKGYTEEEIVDLLNQLAEENEQLITERNLLVQKKDRYYRLYALKDAEVTARVKSLQDFCNNYFNNQGFKSSVDPNVAVKEVLNELLHTEVNWDD